jgi:hypothetical protein
VFGDKLMFGDGPVYPNNDRALVEMHGDVFCIVWKSHLLQNMCSKVILRLMVCNLHPVCSQQVTQCIIRVCVWCVSQIQAN